MADTSIVLFLVDNPPVDTTVGDIVVDELDITDEIDIAGVDDDTDIARVADDIDVADTDIVDVVEIDLDSEMPWGQLGSGDSAIASRSPATNVASINCAPAP
jgi:hypothetical protein